MKDGYGVHVSAKFSNGGGIGNAVAVPDTALAGNLVALEMPISQSAV